MIYLFIYCSYNLEPVGYAWYRMEKRINKSSKQMDTGDLRLDARAVVLSLLSAAQWEKESDVESEKEQAGWSQPTGRSPPKKSAASTTHEDFGEEFQDTLDRSTKDKTLQPNRTDVLKLLRRPSAPKSVKLPNGNVTSNTSAPPKGADVEQTPTIDNCYDPKTPRSRRMNFAQQPPTPASELRTTSPRQSFLPTLDTKSLLSKPATAVAGPPETKKRATCVGGSYRIVINGDIRSSILKDLSYQQFVDTLVRLLVQAGALTLQ